MSRRLASLAALGLLILAGCTSTSGGYTNRRGDTDKGVNATTATVSTDVPTVSTSNLAGARIALPRGWVALQLAAFARPGSVVASDAWCIAPGAISRAGVVANCAISLQAVATERVAQFEPEIAGGFNGNPSQACGAARQVAVHEATADPSLGGRVSDYRRWTFTCGGGVQVPPWEQYTVATAPAFVLSSLHADDAVHAAMAYIAQHSTMPEQTAPLRLFDRGYVRSAERQATGAFLVRIDRVAGDPPTNNDPMTYPYLVPNALITKNPIPLGELIDIRTNGRTVEAIGEPYLV